jgi:hypothetical protein
MCQDFITRSEFRFNFGAGKREREANETIYIANWAHESREIEFQRYFLMLSGATRKAEAKWNFAVRGEYAWIRDREKMFQGNWHDGLAEPLSKQTEFTS